MMLMGYLRWQMDDQIYTWFVGGSPWMTAAHSEQGRALHMEQSIRRRNTVARIFPEVHKAPIASYLVHHHGRAAAHETHLPNSGAKTSDLLYPNNEIVTMPGTGTAFVGRRRQRRGCNGTRCRGNLIDRSRSFKNMIEGRSAAVLHYYGTIVVPCRPLALTLDRWLAGPSLVCMQAQQCGRCHCPEISD